MLATELLAGGVVLEEFEPSVSEEPVLDGVVLLAVRSLELEFELKLSVDEEVAVLGDVALLFCAPSVSWPLELPEFAAEPVLATDWPLGFVVP